MGCAQGKYHLGSPPRGLENLKMENGYMGKGAFVDNRRSTGQRLPGRLNNSDPPPPRNNNGGLGGSGSGSGGEKKMSDGNGARDGRGGRGNGGVSGGGKKGSIKERASSVGSEEGKLVAGWPKWLIDNVPKDVLAKLVPKSAENYEKIDKIGQGTYSNVYKARDRDTGKIVALKKVRFETSEPESVKFMAREIMILQKLDHPNVVKLEGLATSRMQYSLYLVFDFMRSDLATIITRSEGKLTEPQIKCYMQQLLSGLQHCHDRGILHRDIKGSNLLIDRNGMLKIADFGLANYYAPKQKRPLTSRVVTLWYRAPELLLGSTNYGVGIDLWSAGCLLAEMFAGRPIMPGRTEVEQLHRIFKLCGTPPDDYWKKLRLSTTFRPPHSYKPSFFSTFGEFPESSLGLLATLLALDPMDRGSAYAALHDEFFYAKPLACDLSGLPVIWQTDEEPAQENEERRRRSSKIRSQTHRERRKKDLLVKDHAEDSTVLKEVPSQEIEKVIEPINQIQERGSSTSSTSSGTKATRQLESPPFLLSLVKSSSQKMSVRMQGHPNASNTIYNLPPLPSSKPASYMNNGISGLNQVHRSASTREFRKFNQRKHIELFAVDD